MEIWKYPLEKQFVTCSMPKGAEILCAQLQGGTPCIWAKVDPNAPQEMRQFEIHPTGSELGLRKFSYIGTYQTGVEFGGGYVWHVFEVLDQSPIADH